MNQGYFGSWNLQNQKHSSPKPEHCDQITQDQKAVLDHKILHFQHELPKYEHCQRRDQIIANN